MNEVTIVFCNDMPLCAKLGDNASDLKFEEREKYWDKNRWNFRDRAEFEARCLFRTDTVRLVE